MIAEHDYLTKGRFPLIPGIQRKEGYGGGGEAPGDGLADHRRREGDAFNSPTNVHRRRPPPSYLVSSFEFDSL